MIIVASAPYRAVFYLLKVFVFQSFMGPKKLSRVLDFRWQTRTSNALLASMINYGKFYI